MIGIILLIVFLALSICGFFFSKTTKEMPKNAYEWKTELRYSGIGIAGLIHDFTLRKNNRVELYKQPGRVAVITGGNRGIGLRVVEKLLECQMTVVMGVRDPSSAKAEVEEVVDLQKTRGKLIIETLDVGELKSVKEFANKIKEQFPKIDLLINNAGIMFAPHKLTSDGYESHFAINYLGHVVLTHLLMPQLKAAGAEGKNSRIVNVSSCVNVIGRMNFRDINGIKYYYPGSAYAQSKLCQVVFTRQLQRYLDADTNAHVQVNAVHPGIVDTDLFKHSATTSVPFLKKIFFKTPEEGARCVVFAAIDAKVEGKGGAYYSNCVKGWTHPKANSKAWGEELFTFTCDLLKLKPENFGNGEF